MHHRLQEHLKRLKKMGWTFLGLALFCSGTMYLLPTNETVYWLSSKGKEGFYVLSSFFVFLGIYCLGAIWRRKNFI